MSWICDASGFLTRNHCGPNWTPSLAQSYQLAHLVIAVRCSSWVSRCFNCSAAEGRPSRPDHPGVDWSVSGSLWPDPCDRRDCVLLGALSAVHGPGAGHGLAAATAASCACRPWSRP